MTKPAGKTKVHLASDLAEPIILHWGLSKDQAGEWLVIFSNLLSQELTFKNILNIDLIMIFCYILLAFHFHVLLI